MVKKVVNYCIFFLFIVILLYVIFLKFFIKEPVVKLGGYGILLVITGSMDPTIEEKELIIIKQEKNYQVNDIVTYSDSEDNLITHRILEIDEYGFISKGDSNLISDEYTNIDKIQGKVIYHSKIWGVFILYYLKYVILIYLIIIIALFLKQRYKKEIDDESKSS